MLQKLGLFGGMWDISQSEMSGLSADCKSVNHNATMLTPVALLCCTVDSEKVWVYCHKVDNFIRKVYTTKFKSKSLKVVI